MFCKVDLFKWLVFSSIVVICGLMFSKCVFLLVVVICVCVFKSLRCCNNCCVCVNVLFGGKFN